MTDAHPDDKPAADLSPLERMRSAINAGDFTLAREALEQLSRQLDLERYESFPPWVREEIAQGSAPDLRLKLRVALLKAITESKGVLDQASKNADQEYTYLGHAQALQDVRTAMASNGLTIEHVFLEREADTWIPTSRGDALRHAWRGICLITHVEGGILPRVVRAFTMPNDKSAFVASTSIDRVLMLRLMRMGGHKTDEPEQNKDGGPEIFRNQQGGGGGRGGDPNAWRNQVDQPQGQRAQQPQGAPAQAQRPATSAQPAQAQGAATGGKARPRRDDRPATNSKGSAPALSAQQIAAADQMLTELLTDLGNCKSSEQLVTWARIFSHDVKGLPPGHTAKGWGAWGKQCEELKYSPQELANAARTAGPLDDPPDLPDQAELDKAAAAAANEAQGPTSGTPES